jgi:hypothetical protein
LDCDTRYRKQDGNIDEIYMWYDHMKVTYLRADHPVGPLELRACTAYARPTSHLWVEGRRGARVGGICKEGREEFLLGRRSPSSTLTLVEC